jgi:phage tail sheath gpL-like
MSLSFLEIPQGLLAPGFFFEYDSSRAVQGTPAKKHVSLLISHQTTGAALVTDAVTLISSTDEAKALAGADSPLAKMVERYKTQDELTELWVVAVGAPSGAPAVGTFTYSGTASGAGEAVIYVGDDRYSTSVAIGDTHTEVANRLSTQITDDVASLPIAGDAVGVLTVTNKIDGTYGNSIRLGANLRSGEVTPAGLTLVISAAKMAGGSGDADITAAIVSMADMQFDSIGSMFNDDTNMDLLESLLLSRLNALNPLDGQCFIAISDTIGNSATAGNARNFQGTSLIATQESPTPEFLSAAEFAGLDSAANQRDVARPRNKLPMASTVAPPIAKRWTYSQRNVALSDGLTTMTFDGSTGLGRVERLITTYQFNSAGFADKAYFDITAPRSLAFMRYSARVRFGSKYPNHKLAPDEPVPPAGQPIMTPRKARAEFISLADSWFDAGIITDLDQFADELIVELDPNDPDRLNVQLAPNLINGFHVMAGSFQFIR